MSIKHSFAKGSAAESMRCFAMDKWRSTHFMAPSRLRAGMRRHSRSMASNCSRHFPEFWMSEINECLFPISSEYTAPNSCSKCKGFWVEIRIAWAGSRITIPTLPKNFLQAISNNRRSDFAPSAARMRVFRFSAA